MTGREPPDAVAAAWAALRASAAAAQAVPLRERLAAEPDRFDACTAEAAGLLLDWSKTHVDAPTREALLGLARACGLASRVEAMFAGDAVNETEGRPALHVALRRPGDGAFPAPDRDVMGAVRDVRGRVRALVDDLRAGRLAGFSGEPIRALVNIGIGGSDLGPAVVCQALDAWATPDAPDVRFVSNVDASQILGVLDELRPQTTMFVVASKSFGTAETMANARTAVGWLRDAGAPAERIGDHLVAISARPERAAELGVRAERVLDMWDWVGGRYSLWSAIGLPIAARLGNDVFDALLAGAHAMDEHFRTAPWAENLPVVLALIGVLYRDALGIPTRVVLPYDWPLRELPRYLQQLEMESTGKRVTRDGAPVDVATCPVVWGGPGNDGQHAFYQMLHQGTDRVLAEFLVSARAQRPAPGHEAGMIANALAQSEALARGVTEAEVIADLVAGGTAPAEARRAAAHRVVPGDRPSVTLLYDRLSPEVLGALVALYEHRVLVQAACWDVNPFDQWGVELGKRLAARIESAVNAGAAPAELDPSTRGLLARALRWRAGEGDAR